jgi:hypothetical protein
LKCDFEADAGIKLLTPRSQGDGNHERGNISKEQKIIYPSESSVIKDEVNS